MLETVYLPDLIETLIKGLARARETPRYVRPHYVTVYTNVNTLIKRYRHVTKNCRLGREDIVKAIRSLEAPIEVIGKVLAVRDTDIDDAIKTLCSKLAQFGRPSRYCV